MGRRKKSEIPGIVLITLVIIGAGITYWYVVVPIVITGSILYIASLGSKRKDKDRKARQAEVLELMQKLQKDLEFASNGKSLKTRLSNCDDALMVLSKIEAIDCDSNFFPKRTEAREKVIQLKKVLPTLDLIEKRSKQAFVGKTRKELKSLKEILYYIQASGIEDKDFEKLEIKDEASGSFISRSFIEDRLKKLEDM